MNTCIILKYRHCDVSFATSAKVTPHFKRTNSSRLRRTLEAPTSAIVLDLVRIRRSVASLLRKGVGVLPDMVANAVVAILQRIICGQMWAGRAYGPRLVELVVAQE